MDSHQRRLLDREMQRRGLAPKNTYSQPSKIEKPSRGIRFIEFLEHPWLLWPLGVVGGAVGLLLYTPAFVVLIICFAGAFHRTKVVNGLSWKVQVPAYVAVISLSIFIAWLSVTVARAAARDLAKSVVVEFQKINRPKPAPADPTYPPPKGPGIHVTGTVEAASQTLCQNLSDEENISCLCPRPLKYSVRALSSPKDDNYSTEVDIRQTDEPIYRLRMFFRNQIGSTSGLVASPYGEHQAASFVGRMDYDPYSLILHSSAPQNEYKIDINSAEGLRIKCINQEN